MADAGLKRDAAYLVRPDGHVALAEPRGAAASIARYLEARCRELRRAVAVNDK
jgi:hypothetical protein